MGVHRRLGESSGATTTRQQMIDAAIRDGVAAFRFNLVNPSGEPLKKACRVREETKKRLRTLGGRSFAWRALQKTADALEKAAGEKSDAVSKTTSGGNSNRASGGGGKHKG